MEKSIVEVLNLAQAELRACYKRLGINGSNVLDLVDDAYDSLKGGSNEDLESINWERIDAQVTHKFGDGFDNQQVHKIVQFIKIKVNSIQKSPTNSQSKG